MPRCGSGGCVRPVSAYGLTSWAFMVNSLDICSAWKPRCCIGKRGLPYFGELFCFGGLLYICPASLHEIWESADKFSSPSQRIFSARSASANPPHSPAMRPVCLLDRTKNLHLSDGLHFISTSPPISLRPWELAFLGFHAKLHAQTSTLWTLCAALTMKATNQSAPLGACLLGLSW